MALTLPSKVMGQDEVYAADALLELGPAPPLPNKAELAAAGRFPGAAAAAGVPPPQQPQQQPYVPFAYPPPSGAAAGAAAMPPFSYPAASSGTQPPLPGETTCRVQTKE